MKPNLSSATPRTRERGKPPVVFSVGKPFDHAWPAKGDRLKAPEHFSAAYTATLVTPSGSKAIRIGFSNSKRAGHRRQAVVFVDGRPRVRFKASDDFDHSGLMVSVIKTFGGKFLRVEDSVPVEYSSFRIEPYKNHIDGPYTSKNMALVCAKDDLPTMAQHALLSLIRDGEDTPLYGGWKEY